MVVTRSTTTSRADLVKPHLDSFNYFVNFGLNDVVSSLRPVVVTLENSTEPLITYWIESISLGFPTNVDDSKDHRIFPSECREAGTSYCSILMLTVVWKFKGGAETSIQISAGDLPVMVMSDRCHLKGLKSGELVARHEESTELGGYFICKGNERIIRLLQVPRRHIAICLDRKAFRNRGLDYSNLGVSMRCVKDFTSHTVVLHYLKDGHATLRFSVRKQEYLIPIVLMLKCFIDTTDREIYELVTRNDENDRFTSDRIIAMLTQANENRILTQKQCLEHLGNLFSSSTLDYPDYLGPEEVARRLIHDHIFIHCSEGRQKFDLLVHMLHKLFAFASGRVQADNPDTLNFQEPLLGGFLYGSILKERIYRYLQQTRDSIERSVRKESKTKIDFSSSVFIRKHLDRKGAVTLPLEMFLRTGNIVSLSGLDLQQMSGFTIIAERLNFARFMCHFRSIHRGSFFVEMKTTSVRKLLPESWGFLCPVHTPDGTPCGLLNHLTSTCRVICDPEEFGWDQFITVLVELGLNLVTTWMIKTSITDIPVLLNGIFIGRVPRARSKDFVENLRGMKVTNLANIPNSLEITSLLPELAPNQFSEIVLSLDSDRFIRPVKSVKYDTIEWIGASEQTFLNIAMSDKEKQPWSTHIELSPLSMLSPLASMTPFSDFNQSPRNMYQCQMAKQTMGIPFHSFGHRTDNKYYRLETPQQPIVVNDAYKDLGFSDYPLGTNAVVCVIAYTGYDMEDAMIINKSSYERGFAHGSVCKSDRIEIVPDSEKRGDDGRKKYLSNKNPRTGQIVTSNLESDGLPRIGQILRRGDPLYCLADDVGAKATPYKSSETCTVAEIRTIGTQNTNIRADSRRMNPLKIGMKLRYRRNPMIGDKFSSRHGQKGTLSQLWPQESMPFTDSGMTPDILINPHAFPSRMTIGMFIESMAGKVGCLNGEYQDGTPFRFSDKRNSTAVDFFGSKLVKNGFNYYGSEPMYSGISGEIMEVDIFIGMVYYQRLRHMVADKSQVRSTGPIDKITRQPLKGRKMHGGIRFGEMERDSMLAHGTSYLLQDRLLNCSDHHIAIACKQCGSIISPIPTQSALDGYDPNIRSVPSNFRCQSCETSKFCCTITIPFVLRYLCNELAAMNIKLSLDIKETS
uniref:DNA-directed RNA polymerase subunit beta n=1 Tax=Hirondellea gigas TaxID=1518452 RepID=A0A6A7FXU3_9CRUS